LGGRIDKFDHEHLRKAIGGFPQGKLIGQNLG